MARLNDIRTEHNKQLKSWAELNIKPEDLDAIANNSHKGRESKTDANKERFLIALEKSVGNITKAAALSDIPRPYIYEWLKDDETFKAGVDEIQQNVVPDFLEDCLYKAARDGNAATIIYGLNNKGKHRGWSNEQHLTVRTIPQTNIMLPSENAQSFITINGECEEIE